MKIPTTMVELNHIYIWAQRQWFWGNWSGESSDSFINHVLSRVTHIFVPSQPQHQLVNCWWVCLSVWVLQTTLWNTWYEMSHNMSEFWAAWKQISICVYSAVSTTQLCSEQNSVKVFFCWPSGFKYPPFTPWCTADIMHTYITHLVFSLRYFFSIALTIIKNWCF